MNRARSIVVLAIATALIVLASAPAAMAADGVGLWGRTDDKVVTFWGFGVLAFFSILVTVLGIWQMRSESRRERERAQMERVRRPVD
jgi:hypothetical protein